LFLLFIEEASLGQILSKEALHPKGSGGPNQGAEMGQIRVPKSHIAVLAQVGERKGLREGSVAKIQ
jgi:hypothetical protein